MTTDIALVNPAQLPAHLRARIGAASSITSNMLAGIGGSSFKRISTRGGRFRIREGKNETVLPTLKLKAVIVGANPATTKTFFKGQYDPKAEDRGPDCYSNDGVRPAADAEDPQSQLCANCPQNAWGSKVIEGSSQRLKACSDQKRLAIIFADDQSQQPEVYLFQVTPSALSDFSNYAKLLDSKGFPPEVVITEISFDHNASHPKCTFKFGGFVDEAMLPVIDELIGSSQVKEVTGEAVVVVKDLGPAPPRTGKPGVEVVEDVEVIVEPMIKPRTYATSTLPPQEKEPQAAKTVKTSNLTDDLQDILNSLKTSDIEDAVMEEI